MWLKEILTKRFQWTRLRCISVLSSPLIIFVLYLYYVVYMARCWLTGLLVCNRVHVYCISSRFGSFHVECFALLCSCTGPAGLVCFRWCVHGGRGCVVLNDKTCSWHMGVWPFISGSVCLCVLVPNPPFFCVFSRKRQTPAWTLQRYVQTSRSVDPQCGAYLLSDLHTPAVITIQHSTFIHDPSVINQLTAFSNYTDLFIISD